MNALEVMKLPNVKYGEKWKQAELAQLHISIRQDFAKVVWELATTHPQWGFYLGKCDLIEGGKTLRVNNFEVRLDNDVIGNLWTIYYRHQYCIGVSNKRIGKQMERGDMKRTTDMAKAVQLAKKYFGKKSPMELLQEAQQAAKDALNGAVWARDRDMRTHRDPVMDAAFKFVFRDEREQFRAYLTTLADGAKLLKHHADYLELIVEQQIATDVKEAFNADKTCLVVLDGGTYIVKREREPIICTDATLPDYIRSKLGLLKLVNKGQIVSGVGCRVSDTYFVVMLEEETPC